MIRIKFSKPVTKAITETKENVPEANRSTTKTIEEMNETNRYLKALELMNKNGRIDRFLMRPSGNLMKPANKSQFRLDDDADSFWYNSILICSKFIKQCDLLIFKRNDIVFQ